MKKILIILGLTILTSCVSYNQEMLNLNLLPNQKYSDLGGNKTISLSVVDERINKDLGNKRLGEDLIIIKSNQDLLQTIRDNVTKNLGQYGFLTSSENNSESSAKTLEVHIITLSYNAYREFFMGSSKINILLKIVAKDKKSGNSYITEQSLALDKSHFIMPLITTDEKTINDALQEAVGGILSNQKLTDFLKE